MRLVCWRNLWDLFSTNKYIPAIIQKGYLWHSSLYFPFLERQLLFNQQQIVDLKRSITDDIRRQMHLTLSSLSFYLSRVKTSQRLLAQLNLNFCTRTRFYNSLGLFCLWWCFIIVDKAPPDIWPLQHQKRQFGRNQQTLFDLIFSPSPSRHVW